MAKNRKVEDGYHLPIVVTDPTTPATGDPIRFGSLTGVALTDEGDGGNPATKTSVDFSQSVWDMIVQAVNDSGNSAVGVGDNLYYTDADTPKLSKKASGYFFGVALEVITSGATATIEVLHIPSPGAGTLASGSVAGTQLGSNFLSGTQVGNAADANVIGAIPVIFRINIPDAATGDVDVVMTDKIRVIEAWAIKTGGAGGAANTVQVKNGATAITDAMSINIADTTIVRAATIDDAQHEIAAAGTLRVTRTKAGGNAACVVYVMGLRVA